MATILMLRGLGKKGSITQTMVLYVYTMQPIIELPDASIKKLDQFASQQNQSRAALIRDAIAGCVEAKSKTQRQPVTGIWESIDCHADRL